MSNILQLFDPWGYIIFLKYEANLENHLTKLQKIDFVDQKSEISLHYRQK